MISPVSCEIAEADKAAEDGVRGLQGLHHTLPLRHLCNTLCQASPVHICKYLCLVYTICPGSSDPFYIVSYYIRWVTTSWTHSNSGQEFLDSQFPIIAILNSACSNLFDLTRNYIGPKLSTKARTKQTNQR